MGMGDSLMFRVGLDMSKAEAGLVNFRSKLNATFSGAMLPFAALTAGAALFSKGVVSAGAEMEGFENRLSTLMGSTSGAKTRMEELYRFAAQTPFNTQQVVAAEVTLRGFGAAAEELMPGLIDFAAVTGTDLPQAAIDFGKAWNNGAASMESDGAKILRKQIELREGMDATKMSIEAFRKSLLDTLSTGMFAGGADRLSRTFTGMISNLQDEWAGFQRTVADAGVFNEVKALLVGILDYIAKNRDTAKEWAGVLSDGVWFAIKGIGYTAAGIVDIFGGWHLAFAASKVALWELVGIEARFAAGAERAYAATFSMLPGMAGVAAKLRESALAGDATAEAAGKMADAAYQTLIGLSAAPSAMQTFADLLNDADLRAGSMADNIERATGGGAPKAAGGKGGKDTHADARAAAEAFTADMMALDDTATQAAIANMNKRLEENAAHFLAEGESFATLQANEVAIRADAQRQIDEIYTAAFDKLQQEHEAEQQRIKDEMQARMNAVATYAGYASDLITALSELIGSEGEKQKKMHKRLAEISIAIDAAAAIIRGYADLGPVGGSVAAVAIAAGAAAAVATVERQHQGGVVYAHQGMYPDEYDSGNTRRLRQEATLNSQATRALGEQGVRALNGGGQMTTTVNLRVGRAVQQEVVRSSLVPGGQVFNALRSSPSSGDLDLGLTGNLAAA